MTISTEDRKAGPFLGNDSTTEFDFDFKVFDDSDLKVTLTDADGNESTLTLDSDYSVALNDDQDSDPGGSVTYPKSGDPLATGEELVIDGDLANLQPTDLVNEGGFFPKTIEDALDRAVILTQQLAGKFDRAVLLKVSSAFSNLVFPEPSAGEFLRWNSAGTALETATVQAGSSVVSATETQEGIAEIATQAEVNAGTDAVKSVTPATLAGLTASETQAGIAEIATQAEVNAGTDAVKSVTPATLAGLTASETQAGIAEVATQTETNTGADDATIVTPKKLLANSQLAGKVLQVVTAQLDTYASGDTQIPIDDTLPQKTEGFAVVNASITPKSATSKLLIEVQADLVTFSALGSAVAAVFVGTGDDAAGAALFTSAPDEFHMSCTVDSPGTDAVSVQVRVGPTSALTVYINGNTTSRLLGGAAALTLKITEIAT